MSFHWTDIRVTELKRRWKRGESAGVIAKELGAGSRNAVIGKLHRLGLLGTAIPKKRDLHKEDALERKLKRKNERKAAGLDQGIKSKPEPLIDFGSPIGPRINLLLLNDSRCRWPIGDPLSDSFAYCGHKTKSQSIYCQHHHGRAFTSTPRMREPVPAAGGYVCQPSGVGGYEHNTLKPLSF